MKKLIEAITIFGKYTDSDYDISAENDQIWIHVTAKQIHPTSDDGKRLHELGWFLESWRHEDEDFDPDEDESWTMYV